MFPTFPLIRVKKPDKKEYVIEIEKLVSQLNQNTLITIGRQESNHIVLSDPQKNISREHCSLQYKLGKWWIVDQGSSNGTFLRRRDSSSEIDVRNEELIPLKNEDEILILGELDELEKPLFWQLKFVDPEATNQVILNHASYKLEYNLSQQKLFCISQGERQEILLQEKELALIDYMSRKNYDHNNQPLICLYSELIKAVWKEDSFGIDKLDIHHLVWRIRHKIESDSGESQFLTTVRGRGYRLDLKIFS